jgi:hypothetical protein
MNQQIEEFVRKVTSTVPHFVGSSAIIAGGCLRTFFDGTSIKDIDLFFPCYGIYVVAKKEMEDSPDWELVDGLDSEASSKYPSYRYKVDPTFPVVNLIGFRFGGTIKEVVSTFDIRCCAMGASVQPDDTVLFDQVPGATADAAQRLITIINPQPWVRTKKRVTKYRDEYGYRLANFRSVLATRRVKSNKSHGSSGGY